MQSLRAVFNCLWPLWLYHIFPHYLINDTIFGKRLLKIKCVFWFSLQSSSETFRILRRTWRHITINVNTSSCHILFKLDFPRQISEKYSSFSMRTDRHNTTKQIVAFLNFKKAPKNESLVVTCGKVTRHWFYLVSHPVFSWQNLPWQKEIHSFVWNFIFFETLYPTQLIFKSLH